MIVPAGSGMDGADLRAFLDELAAFGRENDARERERTRRMLNITPDTGRLLAILMNHSRHTSGLRMCGGRWPERAAITSSATRCLRRTAARSLK